MNSPPIDPVDAVDIALERCGHRRLQAHEERARLLARLLDVDDALDDLARRRRELVDRLDHLRSEIWPNAGRHHRRPPALDGGPIPPEPADARPLGGVDLRSGCQVMLRRNGQMSLREMHAMLHRYGYRLDGRRPVQRLADAMRYEVACGRARRVERGVYAPADPATISARDRESRRTMAARPILPWNALPNPGEAPVVDPGIRRDPSRWTNAPWPDHAVGDANRWALPVDTGGAHLDNAAADRYQERLRLANDIVNSPESDQQPADPERLDLVPELLATIRRRIVADARRRTPSGPAGLGDSGARSHDP